MLALHGARATNRHLGLLLALFAPIACDAPPVADEPESEAVEQTESPAVAPVQLPRDPALSASIDALKALASARGTVRVIAGLRTAFQPEDTITDTTARNAQRAAMKADQDAVLARMNGHAPAGIKRFAFSPYLAFQASAGALTALAGATQLANIQEDRVDKVALAESAPTVGAPTLWASGDSGHGQTVAILDTGVNLGHPMLAGKVVSEACYSTGLCPGGAPSSTAPGSGDACSPDQDCYHGSWVAGIVAARAHGDRPYTGVAKNANLISIQIFSQVDDPSQCDSGRTSCIRSFVSDQMLALERVYALRGSHRIAAVNLAVSSGHFSAHCDADPRKASIDNLRSAGIATVVPSGNGYSSAGLGAPACISSAISVGATGDSSDERLLFVPSFSNTAPILSFVAPGEDIESTGLGNGYVGGFGTSAASAHVAAIWALLRERYPSASVSQVAAYLHLSSKLGYDERSGGVFSRVHAGRAGQLLPNLALGKPATASGSCSPTSEDPARAVNGNGGDKWCSLGTNQWLRVDLGGRHLVKSFAIKHAGAGGERVEYNSKDFFIEVSVDGTSWSKVVNVTGNTASATSHLLSAAVPARHVRLTLVNPVSSELVAARIYELQVYAEPGTNLARGKPATADGRCNDHEGPEKAFDGVYFGSFNKWCSNTANSVKWLKVDLGKVSLLNRVVVKHAGLPEGRPEMNTRDFDILVSTDDQVWTRVVQVAGNSEDLTTHAFTPAAARYVRLDVTNPGFDSIARIYELEIYGHVSGTNAALKKAATADSSCTTSQTAAKGVNGSSLISNDKWCSAGSNKWLKVDMGTSANVKWFTIKHAGAGPDIKGYNTKAFNIQVSTNNSTWTTVVTEPNNSADVTTYAIVQKSARWVRLNVTTPSVNGDSRARIYELEVYR